MLLVRTGSDTESLSRIMREEPMSDDLKRILTS